MCMVTEKEDGSFINRYATVRMEVLVARKVDRMKLTVVRTQFGTDATNGLLFINGIFECYTLEDQYQAVKVMHETCIPEGTYDIKFRKTGGFHAKYSERYKNAHYGMLHIQDVPNFTYILIHTGNTDEHTSGCLIVGETQQDLEVSKDGFIGSVAQWRTKKCMQKWQVNYYKVKMYL